MMDTLSITTNLQAGSYWLKDIEQMEYILFCSDSTDYLLDISWVENCNISAKLSSYRC